MGFTITLRKGEKEYKINEDYQVDAMKEAVYLLIVEFGLLEQISLPYVMKQRALLNSSPEHPDGFEMASYKKIADGCFLNVDMPGRTKTAQLIRMASECDVDIYFENWPSR